MVRNLDFILMYSVCKNVGKSLGLLYKEVTSRPDLTNASSESLQHRLGIFNGS